MPSPTHAHPTGEGEAASLTVTPAAFPFGRHRGGSLGGATWEVGPEAALCAPFEGTASSEGHPGVAHALVS